MQGVKPERTGWRDEALSRRHRNWGVACCATDIDFLLVEYSGQGRPAAIVEYKNEHAPERRSSHPNYQALIYLGNCAKIPVIAVRYASDFSWWKPVPLNNTAKMYCTIGQILTEQEWVKLLYKMRGCEVTQEVLDGIYVKI